MKTVNLKSNDVKIAWLTPILAILSGYIWQTLIRIIVITVLSRKLGNRQLGMEAMNELLKTNLAFQIAAYAGMEIIMILVAYLIIKKYNNGKFSLNLIGMQVKKDSIKQFSAGFAITLLMQVTFWLIAIISGSAKFMGSDFVNYHIYNGIMSIILTFIVIAFAAFCEEILFRGIMLKYLMKSKGKAFALIVSSLAFALLHLGRGGDIEFYLNIIIVGIVYGGLYIITDSLYLSIGLHFAWDFYGLLAKAGDSPFNFKSLLIFDIAKNSDTIFSAIVNSVEIVGYLLVLIIVFIMYKRKKNNLNLVSENNDIESGK